MSVLELEAPKSKLVFEFVGSIQKKSSKRRGATVERYFVEIPWELVRQYREVLENVRGKKVCKIRIEIE